MFIPALTYGDINAVQPFGNSIDAVDLTGQNLIDVFEFNAKRTFGHKIVKNLLQISGLRVTFNITKPIGQRVVSVETRCRRCESNSAQQYEPIDETQSYRVIVNNYMILGGDGFTIITKNQRNHV